MKINIDVDTIIYFIAGFTILFWLLVRYLYLRRTVHETIEGSNKVVLKIGLPRNNDKSPLAAEQLYSSLHGIIQSAKKSKQMFSCEIVAGNYGIYFMVVIESRYKRFVENQIFAQYPEAEIIHIKDYADSLLAPQNPLQPKFTKVIELSLTKHYFLPIRTFTNFDVDPLSSITSAVAKLKGDEEVWMQIVARPLANEWQTKGKNHVNAKRNRTDSEGKRIGLESGESQELSEIERKNNKVGFQFVIRILARTADRYGLEIHLEDVIASFKQFQTAQFNSLHIKPNTKTIFTYLRYLILGRRLDDKLSPIDKFFKRFLHEREDAVINIEELASIYHLPSKSVETPNIAWSLSKKLEYPLNLPTKLQNARIFGETDYREHNKYFGVKGADRKRHMYVLGKTGTGKSTLLKNMIVADIYEGKGVGVLDPHGDLIEDILAVIPPERVKDVVLFDPSDIDYPVGLNLLRLTNSSQRDIIADGIVEVFKRQFGTSWGPRLQYILLNSILTLLECQNVSLMAATRILVDNNYRKFLLKQVKDPIIKNFWEVEFENIVKNPRMHAEVIAPIQNKVGRFISSPMIRNMIAQVKAPISIQDIMDEGKILLVNLSQGKIGEENSALLGGLFVTKIFSSAMERVSIPEEQRRDFYLYVDEFQNFATNTFVKILSEARKYGLSLIVAHQYIDQVVPEIIDAIIGNVGTIVTFTVGQKDALKLEKEYKPYLDFEDLVNLQRYSFITKVMIDGSQSKPFTAKSLPANFKKHADSADKIRNATRENYSIPRVEIEDKIRKWSEQTYDSNGNLSKNIKSSPKSKSKEKEAERIEVREK